MRIDIVTIFPELIADYFSQGIIAQGVKKGKLAIKTRYLRDYGEGNYKQVDDRVFGGGAGMLLMFEPMAACIADIKKEYAASGISNYKVLATSAKGATYKQSTAKGLAELEGLIILCGRYEGFDQRIIEELVDLEVSIGNYVLSGGELAAMVVADSVARLLPGVLGKSESFEHDSFYADDETIQFPQYTRPEVVEYNKKRLEVPKILLSGNHAEIAKWREQKSRK